MVTCVWFKLSHLSIASASLASALQRLPRGDDSAWDPASQQLINGVVAPAAGIVDYLWNEFDDPASQPVSEPPPQTVPPDWSNPWEPETPGDPAPGPIDIEVFPRPSTNEECTDKPIGAPEVVDRCDVGTMKIIYALECGNEAQNAAITKLLADTAQSGTISTIVDDDCGVLFWTGSLTDEGAEVMRKTYGVLAVVSDIALVLDDLSDASTQSEKRSDKKLPGSKPMQEQVEKRDILVRQPRTIPELAFISSPPETQAIADYVYYSAAGEGITIYIIDSGLNSLHTKFSLGVVKRWIYANGAAKTEVDDDPGSHGSCLASKVAGRVFGVAKKASLIVVKRTLELSSWLDAMVKVANDLRRRARAGERIAGYNVISMQTSSPRIDKYSLIKMRYLILKYLEKYGVIFVCTPGNDARHVNVPASFSPKIPIISVGSVDIWGGALFSSPEGPAITVSAPGLSVECAMGTGTAGSQRLTGTSIAAPAVAGLIAYFLSLPDVGPMLRQRPGSIPQAVKQYVIDMAYIRTHSSVKSIWNGLDGARDTTP
ncbi:hypothetical protein MMC31_004424 [Peltigera leucophlebia]|nr:hypothetical protein [Peltigera leucophlebia]